MPFLEILSPQRICAKVAVEDKSALLEQLADLLACSVDERQLIVEALRDREKLGSTGIGRGVAIPHARIAGLAGPRAALMQLEQPLPFDAIDGQPVDLVAAMLAPEHSPEEHLLLLAELAELFSQEVLTTAMRNATTGSALRAELAEFTQNRAKEASWID
ncbi:MAG TPA: PTS sugar transporter subunit IIA [Dokdonella sp.]|uniref:PTS sugar transporter subunit IIA n=1 Tax=Dokdonella sp. TaxID=2291710 RepID=UPI002D7ED631|nr:PTS sugar transporter subunit IIA [Dokdonella sp.]HET9033349.1 PTS sugar transporter subunit IIA [Dokdonella sp.]